MVEIYHPEKRNKPTTLSIHDGKTRIILNHNENGYVTNFDTIKTEWKSAVINKLSRIKGYRISKETIKIDEPETVAVAIEPGTKSKRKPRQRKQKE